MAVAVPVEMKLPHEAHAAGAISRETDNARCNAIFFIILSESDFVCFLLIQIAANGQISANRGTELPSVSTRSWR
jgi:hypothetical protein